VALAAYLLTLVPRADASMLSTWTDKGTGAVYQLYAPLSDPGVFVKQILLLRSGPSQFNIMGLYVVLMLLAPAILWFVAAPAMPLPRIGASRVAGFVWDHRAAGPVVGLGLSWLAYLVETVSPVKLLHAQFEDPFPLLAWQLLFVHGMVARYYRARLLAWFRTPLGRLTMAACVVLFFGFLFFSWNNPYIESRDDVRLSIIDPSTFTRIYGHYFERASLGIGRVFDTGIVLIVLYGVLTRYWVPLSRGFGWLLIPLGQASLYVFIWQVFYSMAIANVALFAREDPLVNTLGHTAVLLLIWLMVRREFLFRWIPR
jgi:hypothetical protein